MAEDVLDLVLGRLIDAKDRLMKMAECPSTAAIDARILGKVQGINLALSYIGEERALADSGRRDGEA